MRFQSCFNLLYLVKSDNLTSPKEQELRQGETLLLLVAAVNTLSSFLLHFDNCNQVETCSLNNKVKNTNGSRRELHSAFLNQLKPARCKKHPTKTFHHEQFQTALSSIFKPV